MIRIATIEDYDLVVELGQKFIKEAGYEALTDENTYKAIAHNFLTSSIKDKVVFLYEDKGILGGMILPSNFGTQKVASELMWWVEPKERESDIGKELVSAFEYWAKQVGADYINMTCLDDKIGKFYEKEGYTLFQRVYLKPVI